ncbi:hypothetical protein L1987_45092 [Smallanthus sonchifolius]|uniref:Uncharacterized protein n=1 Tax=Smallanthus sonchifolius TaxID=185202 RepID=A0ACB9GSG2_9ASTR|nr:hypothetical protein L1987_45092 [Smallanthus sonchifolius]
MRVGEALTHPEVLCFLSLRLKPTSHQINTNRYSTFSKFVWHFIEHLRCKRLFFFPVSSLRKKGYEDRGERIDDGEAGGGDAKDKSLELKCGPCGPEFSHAECVFLPA